MMQPREALPQLRGDLFLTDGGFETTLIFLEGLDVPEFAAFRLLDDVAGRAAIKRYFVGYADLAERFGTGLVLETPTWRANPDWGRKLGNAPGELAEANRAGVELLEEIRNDRPAIRDLVISGCLGPRGDGYIATDPMSVDEAERYHSGQIEVFAGTAANMVSAITMTHSAEAIGITRAARAAAMPVAISFTLETNGDLPTGEPLRSAIEAVDAATDGYPDYFMINCAHPSHFAGVLEGGAPWTRRLRGLRANASRMSHAELDAASELDAGDPVDLGARYARLVQRFPSLNVLGGCCGTDHRHVEQIARACLPVFAKRRGVARAAGAGSGTTS